MKVLAVLLLCAFVAVQGRSAVGTRALAALGENPWLVHLRIAISTSGYLRSAAGVLVSERWVLSSASATADSRFIWIRYGVVTVINPSLVTEASVVINSSDTKFSLVNINRNIESTANIFPVSLSASVTVPDSATLATFGEIDGVPGESLSSFEVSLVSQSDGSIVASSDEGTTYESDLGAPLVSDGVLVAVLVEKGSDNAGTFLPVVDYLDWIEEETGLEVSSRSAQPEDSLRVQFVN